MLTTDQKATILRRAGTPVPDFPTGRRASQAPDACESTTPGAAPGTTTASQAPMEEWAANIDTLYVEYVARRAAKSLRDAEEARQLSALQRAG